MKCFCGLLHVADDLFEGVDIGEKPLTACRGDVYNRLRAALPSAAFGADDPFFGEGVEVTV